jgi:hypothetical protein
MKLIIASIRNNVRITDEIECPAFSYSKEKDKVYLYKSIEKSMVDEPYKIITNVVDILCREF